jgi:hypothetical protein
VNKFNEKTAFVGRVTASVTHEIQNVLAIVKESAGLMDDILEMDSDNMCDPDGRLKKSIDTVKKQAYRGVTLTSALNGFAHTSDHAVSRVNVYDTLEKMIFLTRRLFSRKGLEITLAECDGSPSIETDGILFQMALFQCLDVLSDIPEISVPLVTTVSREKSGVEIRFAFKESHDPNKRSLGQMMNSSRLLSINEICTRIDAKVEILPPHCLLFRMDV